MMTITKLETHVCDVSIGMVLPKQSLTFDDYLFSNLFDSLDYCSKHYIFEISPMTIRQKNHDQTHLFLYLWQQRTKGIEWLTFIFALQKQLVSQH